MKRFIFIAVIVASSGLWRADVSAREAEGEILANYSELLAKFGAAKEVDQVSIAIEIGKLAERLPEVSSERGGSDSALRRMKLVALLKTLEVVESLQIPEFDFSKHPVLKPSPPEGSGVDVGASPSEIKDLALRAEYETAIKETELKAKRYTEQLQLKGMKESLVLNIEVFLENFLSKQNESEYLNEIDQSQLRKATKEKLLLKTVGK